MHSKAVGYLKLQNLIKKKKRNSLLLYFQVVLWAVTKYLLFLIGQYVNLKETLFNKQNNMRYSLKMLYVKGETRIK